MLNCWRQGRKRRSLGVSVGKLAVLSGSPSASQSAACETRPDEFRARALPGTRPCNGARATQPDIVGERFGYEVYLPSYN